MAIRRNRFARACWLALVLARQPFPGARAAAPAAPLSLAEAQRLGFRDNWDLLAARADVDVALAQRVVAREFPNPTVSLSTSKISTDGASDSTTAGNDLLHRSYDTIAAINQLLEVGGKRRNRRQAAEAGAEGAQARLEDAKRTLELGIARGYVAALQAEASAQVLRQSAQSLRQEAAIAENRLRTGDISQADKDQLEVAAARLQLDAAAAAVAAVTARVTLEVLLGRPQPEGALVLTDTLEALATAPNSETPPVTALPRADLAAAAAAVRKAEAELRLQKALRLPDPTVSLQYEREPPDKANTIGFGLSLPLPLWNHNRGAILGAEAAREQARLAVAKLQAQIAAEIAAARLGYDEARSRWRNYREVVRPKSEDIRKTVAYAYAKGGASLLDLLTAERNDNEVRLAATQAASDAALAGAVLRAVTSGMPLSPTPR